MADVTVYNQERLEDSAQSIGLDKVQPDTLANRLSKGPLPLGYALQCATDVANSLRALHEEGRLHGSVSADSIVISGSGAQLLPPNGRAKYTVAGADISAFGALLHEMLTGAKPSPRSTPPLPAVTSRNTDEGIKIAATRLASKCLRSTSNAPVEIQKVLTEIRLLCLQAKIREKHVAAAPPPPAPKPDPSFLLSAKPLNRSLAPRKDLTPPAFTPLPADGFMATKEIDTIDPPPSGVKCANCGVPYVYPSRPKTWFETMLVAWGSPPLRCHRCLHRYVVVLNRFTFAKNSPLKARSTSPTSPR